MPFSICECVDLRVAPSARAANSLLLLPPFPPAAERCALTCVESRVSGSPPPSKLPEQAFPDAAPRPAHKADSGDALPESLSEFQIAYEHIAALGGLRGRSQDLPAAVNAFWKNKSFHNYADYAISENFHSGFIRLRELGHAKRCAIMCAEMLWWRCHRRIIADYLIAAGEKVFHILDRDHIERAQMTEGAKLGSSGVLIYPGRVGKIS